MKLRAYPRVFALTWAAAYLGNIPGAAAQNRAPDAAEGQDPGQLQEIVITAQRRAERLQEVPISAVVIGQQMLVTQNLNSLVDVTAIEPSVHTAAGGRSNDVYIRGIGSGANQGFDQSAGTFIDDIYHGRAKTSTATFLDLDHVEILKGPQSTFFGNNAIAGAFNIVTEKPTDQFDAYARLLYGQYGQYVAEGAVGGPINNVLAVRAAITFNGERGWATNVNTGEKAPRENNVAGRVSFLYRPTEYLDATLKIEGGRNNNESGLFLQVVNCPPAAPFVAAGFCKAVAPLGIPTGIESNNFSAGPGQLTKLDTGEDVLTVNYHRWNQTFTSVTGFYSYHYHQNLDVDGTPLTFVNVQDPEDYHQFSQELRVASPAGRRIEYLAGLYFQTDDLSVRQDTNYSFLSPTIQGTPPFAGLIPYLPIGQDITFSQVEHSYSAFGSLSWNITDALKLTGGIRGSWVNKSYDWNLYYGTATEDFGAIAPLPAALANLPAALKLGSPATLNGDRSDHAAMPSAKLQYKINPAVMVYLSYARGFKSGGFNVGDTSGVAANIPYSPEHVNAYEAGLKSVWFDDRLLMNLAIFRSDYSDLQVAVNSTTPTGAIISRVRNAAESRSQGVELESRWAVSRNFRLGAEVSYLDSRYRNYQNVTPTSLQSFNHIPVQDLSGRPTEFAPKWSANLTQTYSVAVSDHYDMLGELTEYFTSRYFYAPTDDPLLEQGGYGRLDARLGFQTSDSKWGIDLVGKNLTDRNVAMFGQYLSTSLGSIVVQKEQPRSVVIQARYHW